MLTESPKRSINTPTKEFLHCTEISFVSSHLCNGQSYVYFLNGLLEKSDKQRLFYKFQRTVYKTILLQVNTTFKKLSQQKDNFLEVLT